MANVRPSDPSSASLLAVTQTAVGCGIGLLIAGKLQRPTQKTTAATLLSLGVLLAIPAVVQTVLRVWQNPESDRGARRRLNSIRQDPGLTDETEVF
jgi:ABC-type transport system involved in cytochrome bd biosynthesis fused ATPase/permease subunit